MKRVLRILPMLTVLLFVLLILGLTPWSPLVPFTLLFGWIPSAARLLRAWHPNAGAVVLFSVASLTLTVGSHFFLRWLLQHTHSDQAGVNPPCWRWKWTLCGFGIIFCSLLAVCSLVLTTHQLYWISRSHTPLLANISIRASSVAAAHALQTVAEEMQWDTRQTQNAFWTNRIGGNGDPTVEHFQPVWIEADEQRLRAIILLPRQSLHRHYARLAILEPGKAVVTKRLEQRAEVLASFGIQVGSLGLKAEPTLLP